MADEANVLDSATPVAETVITDTAPQQSITDMMNYAFGVMPEAPVISNDEPANEGAAPIVGDTDAAATVDYTPFIKETFGKENVDEVKAEWAALQELKNKAATTEEIKFANEQSKTLYEALLAGEYKKVKQHFDVQEMLADSETMSEEQKLKLYIKLQNPKFSDKLIEDEYNEIYNIDEESIFDDSKLEREKLKLQQRKEKDVIKADEFFAPYKAKIELPQPKQIQQQPTVDEEYEALKASNARASEAYNTVTVPKVNALKESDISFKVNVNDANNQMQFEASISPDKDDFAKAKLSALEIMNYVAKNCYDEQGNFHAEKLARIVLLNDNFDKYAQSIARQAVNAERKRVIETETGGGNGARNYNVTGEKTELQKQMEFALS